MNRIVLVEDNPDNQLLIEVILEGVYDLTSYPDGPSALEAMTSAPPDVALLDISLPGMDGVEIRRRMREIPELSAVPAIALTAHAMAGDREAFLAKGFDEYVSKPIVDIEDLTDAIEACLQLR